jgi:hypothetical protein
MEYAVVLLFHSFFFFPFSMSLRDVDIKYLGTTLFKGNNITQDKKAKHTPLIKIKIHKSYLLIALLQFVTNIKIDTNWYLRTSHNIRGVYYKYAESAVIELTYTQNFNKIEKKYRRFVFPVSHCPHKLLSQNSNIKQICCIFSKYACL